jgi:hypothetical protein
MGVRLAVVIEVDGDGPVERSLREMLAWLDRHEHTAAYHEMAAQVAVFTARQHWQDAAWYQRLEDDQARRQEQAAARKAARSES